MEYRNPEEKARWFREKIEEAVNTLDSSWMKYFCEREWFMIHRTLQQSFFKLLMKLIESHANTACPDARNEASVTFCRKVMDEVELEDRVMPFI